MKGRIEYIDTARGIAILGVLVGHAMYLFDCHVDYISNWFWSFHMPLFAILSGFFFKQDSVLHTIKKGFKTLILPYYIVSIISFVSLLLLLLLFNGGFPIKEKIDELCKILYIDTHCVPFGFWFVLALFVARIYYSIIMCLCKTPIGILIFSFLLFALGYFIFPIKYSYLFSTQALLFPLFMFVGQTFKRFGVFDKTPNTIIFVISLFILSFAWKFNVDLVDFWLPLGLINIITTSCICFAILIFCRYIVFLKNYYLQFFVKIISFFGKHSLLVLSAHSYLIYLHFWAKVPTTNSVVLSFMFVGGALSLAYLVSIVISCIKKYKTNKPI